MHIAKVKTFHGLKYAVVDSYAYDTKDEKGKVIRKTEFRPVEYTVGKGLTKKTLVAVFPLTAEGLAQAKGIQEAFKVKMN